MFENRAVNFQVNMAVDIKQGVHFWSNIFNTIVFITPNEPPGNCVGIVLIVQIIPIPPKWFTSGSPEHGYSCAAGQDDSS